MKAIETIITARMLVHNERPAMDDTERLHTETRPGGDGHHDAVHPFLQYEPYDSQATVQSVTVTFAGHVLS